MSKQQSAPAERPNTREIKPLRLRKCDTCKLLRVSRNGLHLLQQRDPTFPKEVKDGNTRQAPVYFFTAEIEAWLAAQIAKRDGLAVGVA